METRTTTLRWALLAAAGLVIVGLFWDSAYHARNRGPEAGLEMLESHGVMWAGLLAAIGVSALALARGTERRRAFAFALGGALAGILGHGLDVYAHETDGSAALAHVLFTGGELVLVVAAVVLSPRSLRLPGAATGAPPTSAARTRRSGRSGRRR